MWKSVVLLVSLIGAFELFSMIENKHPEFKDIKFISIPLLFLSMLVYLFYPSYSSMLPSSIFLVLAFYFMFNFKNIDTVIMRIAYSFLSIAYMLFTLVYLANLISLKDGRYLIFLLVVITWGNDTFAYTFGRLFGKRKLYKSLSPNKSIEGAIGGFLSGIGLAIGFKFLFLKDFNLVHIIIIAIILGPVGQAGDLIESMFKRAFKVKDSGNIIPGHGGILDRLDAVIINAPVLYFYIIFLVY